MVRPLLDEIIANFNLQLQLYREMGEQSQRQLAALQNSLSYEDLNPILDRRRQLLQDLDRLNARNREIQQEVLNKLDLKGFTLSQLKQRLDSDELAPLELLIDQLGLLLRRITATDNQNQRLMARRQVAGMEKKAPVANHIQVRQAYEQAVQQKKDKGSKSE